MYATSSFAPPGLTPAIWARTHGLRRGLHSSAAPRLPDQFDFLEERHRNAVTDITIAKRVVSKWDPQNASSDRGSSVEPGVHSSEGAKECSPRRKAWVTAGQKRTSSGGAKETAHNREARGFKSTRRTAAPTVVQVPSPACTAP